MKYFVESLPRSCFYCDCCHTKQYDSRYKLDGEKFCGIENMEVGYYYDHNYEDNAGRPNWCPLREIPEQKEIFNNCDDYLNGVDDGWNECIDAMIGE